MKKIEREILALILMAFFTMTTVSIKSEANLDYGKAWSNGYFPVEKLEPKLWNRIQELKANETTDNESLIIWLSENRIITNKSIEGLKTYVSSLLESSHNASVYRICESLPVIMATVSLKEVESIADYEFIDYIYDNEPGYLALDISKSGIRSSSYFEGIANYNGSGLSIAIIDTGINIFHPDLDDLDDDPSTNDPKVIQEISFVDWNNDNITDFGPMDNYGHGTHVAGIAAGTGETSGNQYVGVAPGAWLWNYKVGEMEYQYWDWNWQRWVWHVRVDPDDVVAAIDHAIVQGADIINLSLGFEIGGNGTHVVSRAADRAVTSGIVVVAAAGNWGIEYGDQSITAPGDAFDVITVGAINDNNTRNIRDDIVADFSSRGPTGDGRTKPDIMAPGVDIIAPVDQGSAIWQTWPEFRVGNFYAELSGTSMAAPHVAGVAALILQAHPDWTPAMVKCAIKATANLNDLLVWPTPNRSPENDRGKGIVDASRAVSCSTEIPPDQADSKYEDHWGNSDAIAYLNGTFKIWAAGTVAGDARAESRLNKSFIPSHDMSNTTFFFGFHDIGYMESDLGYATFYATLKLWQGNTTLASTEEKIHQVDWCHAYDANCFHTIQLTYQDELLAGQQYKLEYGFWTFAHVAWSNFYDVKPSAGITALHLSAISTIGIGNPSLEERIFFGSVYEVAYWYTPGPYLATNNSGWRNVRGDLGGPINYIPTWGAFDGKVDSYDLALFKDANGKDKYSHKYYWYADFNGDEQINAFDLAIFIDSFKYDKRYYLDGLYSWFATGTRTGGDYIISQWLCDHDVNAMKGQQINFTFWFKPQTLTQNNASAEIHYVLDNGTSQTINGALVCPTQITWYNPYVVASIPANTIAIKIIIHGGPSFKAWVDKTSITIT